MSMHVLVEGEVLHGSRRSEQVRTRGGMGWRGRSEDTGMRILWLYKGGHVHNSAISVQVRTREWQCYISTSENTWMTVLYQYKWEHVNDSAISVQVRSRERQCHSSTRENTWMTVLYLYQSLLHIDSGRRSPLSRCQWLPYTLTSENKVVAELEYSTSIRVSGRAISASLQPPNLPRSIC